MQNEKVSVLKHNIVLLITTQDELNQLAELEEGVCVDALHINEPYICFKDSDGAIQILPQSQASELNEMQHIKPRKFSGWYRTNKGEKNE